MELSVEKPESIVKLYDENSGLWRFVKTDKGPAKSMETIEKALRGLGLSKNEVKVYVYLARTGEHKASEISEALSLHRTETYRILRDLEKRGLISSVFEKPLKFIATPFEKALDILIETKRMKLNLLEKKRQNLVNIWLSLPKPEVELERKEVFQILEGEEQISLKADEILGKAEKEILVFISENDIANFYHSGFLDRLEKTSKKGVTVQLLTNYSPKTCFFIEKIKLKKTKYSRLNSDELPTFIMADNEQLLLLIRKENGKKKVAALWTNYDAFIKALKILFTELWNNDA
ncbi:MAG: helix-turn-helix domain-containing protein [Candidatus Bathyarchaeota archaeon]|jgi:sugar-specific transcriptional regulator TrmB|nr:TrmB family transcriptional regulator [Candidatus Bathyarchaeota archaeon A05DMB-3]MDH7607309.1 helix-turn-helix domain-containing protein [Candidatus Bathyarchaeota archaeon]